MAEVNQGREDLRKVWSGLVGGEMSTYIYSRMVGSLHFDVFNIL